ncbi:hypothetical protein [Streptomyces sp. NRRL B-3648]|uniref:hypothetical protein n=1 Tax=Streptomyces sp. NRRL B-3648 TaxID=1519493 RepID=UPI0006AE4768|nr:hypothetical protein [Streptomyces sp. NRRL B-3648]KOV93769.1 hypothetical protein ADL04_26775 [Streptomyces sp. NRRL B-3648]
MSAQAFQGAYLLPLFHAIEQARGEHAYRQLPAPAPAGSLAADDAPLGPYSTAHLIQNSCAAGLAHADALRRLTAAGEVDATSPWTLLRGALESFATGLWLLDGTGRSERRCRALSRGPMDRRVGVGRRPVRLPYVWRGSTLRTPCPVLLDRPGPGRDGAGGGEGGRVRAGVSGAG